MVRLRLIARQALRTNFNTTRRDFPQRLTSKFAWLSDRGRPRPHRVTQISKSKPARFSSFPASVEL